MCHKIWEKNARFVLEKMFGMSQMPPLKSTWGGSPPPSQPKTDYAINEAISNQSSKLCNHKSANI